MNIRKKFPLVLVLLLILVIWVLWANTALETTEYTVTSHRIPDSFSGFRIAQVSDLHNAEFGEDNSKLLRLLDQADPDIIVITGDLIDSRNTDIEIALEFARQAVWIAPVYYISGNHEARVSEYRDLKACLKDAGVVILENQKVQFSSGGNSITLMGIDDPSFRESYLFGDSASVAHQAIEELQDESDGYTILLSHRPELFDVYVAAGMDLVLAGHAHGGQFRLPFLGGLVAPNQGFFPEYDAGQFSSENTTMIVSRGLGNSIIPLRFNNRPEVILVTLRSSKSFDNH